MLMLWLEGMYPSTSKLSPARGGRVVILSEMASQATISCGGARMGGIKGMVSRVRFSSSKGSQINCMQVKKFLKFHRDLPC